LWFSGNEFRHCDECRQGMVMIVRLSTLAMNPGEGSARNSINCRCVLTFEFFETEAELQTWLAGE